MVGNYFGTQNNAILSFCFCPFLRQQIYHTGFKRKIIPPVELHHNYISLFSRPRTLLSHRPTYIARNPHPFPAHERCP